MQRSATDAVRGAISGKDADAQHALLAPVQQRQAVGAKPAAPVQMHAAPGARHVQRLETPPSTNAQGGGSATPHGDVALDHVRANPVGSGNTGGDGAPVITVPQDYDSYVAHIKQTFASELEEIRVITEQLKAKSKETQGEEAKLELAATELNWYDHELRVMGRSIEELSKAQQARVDTLEKIKGYQGKTMDELHAAAQEILAKYEDKTKVLEVDKAKLETIMLASIELGSQINPEGASKIRFLYMSKIDNEENQRLVTKAESERMPPADLASLAVKYRTWSKTFVRTELMVDHQASEILFMRDLGADGREVGVTPESLAEKLFIRSQKVPPAEKIPFEKASQEQRLATYKAMIAKAKETNPNVNAALTAPRMNRPLGLPDDQPSPPQ